MSDEPPCGSVIYLFHTFPASRGIFSTRPPAERGLCHSRPQSPFVIITVSRVAPSLKFIRLLPVVFPLNNVITEGVITTQSNGMKFRLNGSGNDG